MATKKQNADKIGIARFWGWQARAVSLGCMTVVYGYLMIYCTNTLMLSPELVGTLLLVSKLFDGVTDLFAGYLIDNTHTRFGKARPYEFAIIGVWLCTWLLFSCPAQWSYAVKAVWVFVIYSFVNSILATLLNTNQTTYVVRAFPTMSQIMKVNSYGGIVVTLGCAVVSMSFPTLMGTMATSSAGWSKLVGIYALPLALIGILRFVLVKETVPVDADSEGKIKAREVVAVLKSNKYIYIVAAMSILYNITLGMNASSYYFTYIVGDISKYMLIASLSMPMLLVMFVFPVMMKKVPISRIVMLGCVCGAAGYLLNFAAGANIVLLMIAGALYGLGGLPIAYISGMLILDCAEYNALKGMPRAEGTMSAFSSFGSKLGQGIGSALLGVLLGAAAFDGNLAADAQAASALTMIRSLYSIIPAIVFILIFVTLYFYKLDKVLPELRAKKAAQGNV